MIIDIGTEADESVIRWKHKETDEWQRADIDELIDAYESIVRCKDCRWWNCKNLNYQHNNHLCRYWSKFGSVDTSADDFCSYGEKKEEE